MKNIISITLIAAVLMASCGKSFIDREPLAAATVNQVYKTDKDFNDAVVGAYTALRDSYNNFWQFGDIRGDDAFIQVSNQPTTTNIDVFSINSSDNLLNNTWAWNYVIINRANAILDMIVDADPAIVKNKDRYEGEAKFLRALAYFNLVRIFGPVQMITKVSTVSEVSNTPRTPETTIYNDVIIKDLLDAGDKLPQSYSGTDVGRATRGAAKAILGKVYLTVKDFQKAELVLAELTTAPYTYALLPNFNDLFDYTKNEHHSEYVFDIEYEEGLGGLGSPFTRNSMPNVTAILNYYQISGGFNESISPTMLFINLWNAADKRKDISILCCGSWTNPTTGVVTTFSSQTAQSITFKYATAVASQNDSRANWKVTRYADVLLMLAEALNENGKTTDAVTRLNQVHTRAGLPAFGTLTQEQARESIELERRFELCFEGHRWFDLLRTGKALQACAPVGMKDYMTVFPIPLTQMQVMNNPTLFPQNPGYN